VTNVRLAAQLPSWERGSI